MSSIFNRYKNRTCCVESVSPDDKVFKLLANAYSEHNGVMKSGDSCPPDNFTNGVTNGAHWYEVAGTHNILCVGSLHSSSGGGDLFLFFRKN